MDEVEILPGESKADVYYCPRCRSTLETAEASDIYWCPACHFEASGPHVRHSFAVKPPGEDAELYAVLCPGHWWRSCGGLQVLVADRDLYRCAKCGREKKGKAVRRMFPWHSSKERMPDDKG